MEDRERKENPEEGQENNPPEVDKLSPKSGRWVVALGALMMILAFFLPVVNTKALLNIIAHEWKIDKLKTQEKKELELYFKVLLRSIDQGELTQHLTDESRKAIRDFKGHATILTQSPTLSGRDGIVFLHHGRKMFSTFFNRERDNKFVNKYELEEFKGFKALCSFFFNVAFLLVVLPSLLLLAFALARFRDIPWPVLGIGGGIALLLGLLSSISLGLSAVAFSTSNPPLFVPAAWMYPAGAFLICVGTLMCFRSGTWWKILLAGVVSTILIPLVCASELLYLLFKSSRPFC